MQISKLRYTIQILNFRYANMDFFQTPHIQIRFLWKDPVFKYEYLEIFIYPWNANIATYPLCKQLFLFASQDYAHNMSYIPLQLLWQVSRILTPMPSGWAISLTGSASIASTTGKLLLELYQSHASLRDVSRFQIGWIFGKVQNGLWPPPHFRKVTLRFSRQNCDKSAYVHMEALLCIIWSYFPWDACSTW